MSIRASNDDFQAVAHGALAGDRSHADTEADAVSVEIGETYFNRELSWLEFNDRVLEEARNPSARTAAFPVDLGQQSG